MSERPSFPGSPRPAAREAALAPSAETAAPDARVAAALALLEGGVERLLDDAGFADYLRAMARFHEYSHNNILLIAAQRPDATRVAGYRRWRELGRQVGKGERGILILVPHLVRDRDDVDEAGRPREKLVGFGTAHVFDIAQTTGRALPAPPAVAELAGSSERGRALYDHLERALAERGVAVVRDPALPANGAYYPTHKLVALHADLAGDQAAKTLAHEAAHHVADHQGLVDRRDAETVAESVAFVVLHRCGLDSGGYTFPYVAGWAARKGVLQRNLHAIRATSHALIRQIERLIAQEPGRDHRVFAAGPDEPAA